MASLQAERSSTLVFNYVFSSKTRLQKRYNIQVQLQSEDITGAGTVEYQTPPYRREVRSE
jgi:hypothetical protein